MSTGGKSYTIRDDVVCPLTPRKYAMLNWNFLFELSDVFQEPNLGVKRDLPV